MKDTTSKRRGRGFFQGAFNADDVLENLELENVATATKNENINNEEINKTRKEIVKDFNTIYNIPLKDIEEYEHQSRQYFDDEDIKLLATSIKSEGLINPIILKKVGKKYQVVAGERRLRACRLNSFDMIPSKIITDKNALVISVIDNIQRKELHPLEEAKDYIKLIDAKVYKNTTELAKKIGVTRTRVTELIGFYNNIPNEKHLDLISNGVTQRSILRSLASKEGSSSPKTKSAPIKNLLSVNLTEGKISIKTSSDIILSVSHKKALETLLREIIS